MATNYDDLYRDTPDALGAPFSELVDFFETQPKRALKVLDLGCGQGRDALFIARFGHQVHGVDKSRHGVAQMLAAARVEGLHVTGSVADVTAFTPSQTVDVLLVDRTLHMLDESQQHNTLARCIGFVSSGGWCLIVDEPRNIARFEQVLTQSKQDWAIQTTKRSMLYAQVS